MRKFSVCRLDKVTAESRQFARAAYGKASDQSARGAKLAALDPILDRVEHSVTSTLPYIMMDDPEPVRAIPFGAL
jgi:hypothetical protein